MHLTLNSKEMDARVKRGDAVSANFVIPYPPGFPIMAPGQVITPEIIELHAQTRREGNPRLPRRHRIEIAETGSAEETEKALMNIESVNSWNC